MPAQLPICLLVETSDALSTCAMTNIAKFVYAIARVYLARITHPWVR